MKTLSLLVVLAAAALAETPRELVGEWANIEGSNPAVFYRITADGRFEHSSTSITAADGCDMRITAASEGQIAVEHGILHLNPVSARFRSVNNCRPKWDFEKPGQLGRNSFRWRISREGPAWVLVLQQRSGTVQRYFKR